MKKLLVKFLLFLQAVFIVQALKLEQYTFQPIYFGNWAPILQNPKDLKNNIIIAQELLNKHPKSVLLVVGHAGKYFPSEGPEDKDKLQKLSKDRAKSVQKELIALGIPKERIIVKAIGNRGAQIIPKLNENYEDFQTRAQKDRKTDIFFVQNPDDIEKLIESKVIKPAQDLANNGKA